MPPEVTEVSEAPEVTTEAAPEVEVAAPAEQHEETPREALETATAARMADVFKDADDDEEVAAVPEVEKEDAEKPADKAPPAAATPSSTVPAEPLVPAAYRRSLKAYQWTDEEIDAAAKADSATFLSTAAKLHETRNAQTREMSELGRRLKEQQKVAEAGKAPSMPAKFDKVDIAALEKVYGKDEPFVKQVASLNSLVDFANQVMPWMQASQERQQKAELETLTRQIDSYFASSDLKPYHDTYGKDGAKLDDKQLAARQQVLDTADLLIAGARQLGKSLTLEEALTLAHDSVSGPVRESKARQAVVKQVKTRQQAISLRPGSKTAVPAANDRKALEGAVKQRLAKVFA